MKLFLKSAVVMLVVLATISTSVRFDVWAAASVLRANSRDDDGDGADTAATVAAAGLGEEGEAGADDGLNGASEAPQNSDTPSPGAGDLEGASRISMVTDILNQPIDAVGEALYNRPNVPNTTHLQDTLLSGGNMRGVFSTTETFFFIPEYWDTRYVYVEIQYKASELLQESASSLTFAVNNVNISSCSVEYGEGDKQIIYVNIPMDLTKEGFNSFAITSYIRSSGTEGCSDDLSGANWLNIDSTSYVRCGYELDRREEEIAGYPYPFITTVDESADGLAIAVSDQVTNQETAAAMNLMADLSSETVEENNIQICLLSELEDSDADRVIIIAEYANLPKEYQELTEETTRLQSEALVLLAKDPWDRPLLLITSANPSCLSEAVFMLMDEGRVTQEVSNTAWVRAGSSQALIGNGEVRLEADHYTIGEIVGSGLAFVGPFHQEQFVYLPFAEDFRLADTGWISLNFRYSDNLNFDRSLITVYWGNVPVASKKLTRERATGDELTFMMPDDVVGTNAGMLRVAFDLEIQDMLCTYRQEQIPWAYVLDQSTLYLPSSGNIGLSFELRPSPFRTEGRFHDVLMILSDEPTGAELNLYGQLIGIYGEGVEPYGNLLVKRAGEFLESDANYNIITAGTYQDNQMIKTLNPNLYFTFADSGKSFLSNEQLVLSDAYAGRIGILQLLASPFAENRGVLAVTSTNAASLTRLEEFIRVREKRYGLLRDCVIVDDDWSTRAFQFNSADTGGEKPTLLGTLNQNRQSLIFTLTATAVMLMLLIGIVIILLRIRMYNKKRD